MNNDQEKLQQRLHEHDSSDDDDRAPLSKRNHPNRLRPSVASRLSVSTIASKSRRSSIFLTRRTSLGDASIATIGGPETYGGGGGGGGTSQAHLHELYKKAIRMNAENRINASNSWNLHLIEHIDKFMHDDDDIEGFESVTLNEDQRQSSEKQERGPRRINFTKASCTLDASIKIYSYRVDDIHLTSYKVLANLNRNEKGKLANSVTEERLLGSVISEEVNDENKRGHSNRRKLASKNGGPTLESNLANINLNKLDAAPDIDPLFHKMSKNFDEGGAKGLLLVNLGVGSHCNIVFDSSCDDIEESCPENESCDVQNQLNMINMTSFPYSSKLFSLLNNGKLEIVTLVPQLLNLRNQLDILSQQGFADGYPMAPSSMMNDKRLKIGQSKKKRGLYAAPESDEAHADLTIHQEMREWILRPSTNLNSSPLAFFNISTDLGVSSCASPESRQLAVAVSFSSHSTADEYAPDDFGKSAHDDYDGDYNNGGNDLPFDSEPLDGRPTASSFDGEVASLLTSKKDIGSFKPLVSSSQATALCLDMIGSSKFLSKSDYEFLDSRVLTGNVWAGASFWRRKSQRKQIPAAVEKDGLGSKRAVVNKKSKKKSKQEKSHKLDKPPDLVDILIKPKKQLLYWSRAVISKHSTNDNLLPLDAGMGVDQLSQLFLRPDASIHSKPVPERNIIVGFDSNIESSWGHHDDESLDDRVNDGPGFEFADDDEDDHNHGNDCKLPNLDKAATPVMKGIRKVRVNHVGYATVAKKIDVKRLKKDLWNELECRFLSQQNDNCDSDDENLCVISSREDTTFQSVVQGLENYKTQADVSLPFYFICILHLANEKGLKLDSQGLGDFIISRDKEVSSPSF